MNIKPTQPAMPSYESYIAEIKDIWETKALTNNGPKVQKFKAKLEQYLGVENVDLFTNGHSALYLALKASDLRGEVITSPFTFVSTTNAIVQNGLTPVFCDIDDSYNIDSNKIEELITEKTCAIVTPHIFGIPCEVQKIQEIAGKYNLKVIYDGAQAFGTKIGDKHIGYFGDATMFSFHAIKVFNSIEGGMIAYRDAELHRKFELYRNFGISYEGASNDVLVSGINAKMNEFQAAMGLCSLEIVDEEIKKRKELAQIYVERLNRLEGVSTYNYQDNITYNYAYFPIRIDEKLCGINRDTLHEYLKNRGIGTRKLYDKISDKRKTLA